MRIGILYILWVNVLSSGYGGSNYNQNSLALYYLAITFMSFFNEFNYGKISNDIREGSLATHLLLPYNYFLRLFFGSIPMMVLSVGVFFVSLPILRLFGIQFGIDTLNLPLGLAFLVIVSITNFALSVAIGSLAFWFRRVHAINFLIFGIGSLFSGELIPVDLLPKNFSEVSSYLPFKYLYFYPAKFLTQPFSFDVYIKTISIAILWGIIMSVTAFVIWKKGLSKFDAVGR